MRLWHQALIPYLDHQHLLGQNRECCALRGGGWGRKHATVDYVFEHEPFMLYRYHIRVMLEMKRRGYHPDQRWALYSYRGLQDLPLFEDCNPAQDGELQINALMEDPSWIIYPEHDEAYLKECIVLLKTRNAPMDFERVEKELNIKGEK